MPVDDVVAFYDRLQEVALGYIIPIIPFDAIVLAHKFEGLCPPGLGLVKYAAMCKALIELLPWLIHGSLSPQVNATGTYCPRLQPYGSHSRSNLVGHRRHLSICSGLPPFFSSLSQG